MYFELFHLLGTGMSVAQTHETHTHHTLTSILPAPSYWPSRYLACIHITNQGA
jgi:hypothetical protein